MGALAAIERFLERLFERQTARLFRTEIRPIQVQRRIERAMEAGRTRDGGRTAVAHRYAVRLAPTDLAALTADPATLAGQLADAALAFARSRSYTLADRPIIRLVPDERIQAGDIRVDGEGGPSPADEATAEADRNPGLRPPPAPQQTAVFVVPTIEGPRATLVEVRSDGVRRPVTVDGRQLTIGRGPDNGLVLRDGRVSRNHARIDNRRGALVLVDLRSTNGSWVNGRRVEEIALGEGDRIRLGDTTLLVESLEAERTIDAPPAPPAPQAASSPAPADPGRS